MKHTNLRLKKRTTARHFTYLGDEASLSENPESRVQNFRSWAKSKGEKKSDEQSMSNLPILKCRACDI